jgi:hypothetical protein
VFIGLLVAHYDTLGMHGWLVGWLVGWLIMRYIGLTGTQFWDDSKACYFGDGHGDL